ncbi:ABC transporter permease [Halotalea alkalilenta]|uniref:ABC transporter permease n=1 Tax=Halotalea alkalilenta TaxID=376489 RepID=UPI000A6BCE4A|nr:ABC transporter permease [Halotalea alkalilenta]
MKSLTGMLPYGRLILLLIALGLIWQVSSSMLGVPDYYLPGLDSIFSMLHRHPSPFIAGFVRTASEMLLGLGAGTAFGLCCGVALHRFVMLRQMLLPLLVVSQTVPVIAFGALVVMWFGNSLWAKAVIAFYLTFFTITVNTLAGLAAIDPRRISLLRSFGASPGQILLRLQLPMAGPAIFTGLKLAVALSLSGAVVGEWFGDTTGLGVLLLQSMYNEDTVTLWATILLIALLGSLAFALVGVLERWLLFWQPRS